MILKREDCLVYAVTDRAWLRGKTLAERTEEALRGGATMVQLREKDLAEEEFEQEARELQKLCRHYRVPFLINDNVELAKKLDADGVHVGQDDMDPSAVRALLGQDKIVGVTAKTVEQARSAEAAGADYLGSGAVFGTLTKGDAKPLSPEHFREICSSVSIPVVAIGGINAGNMERLAGCGMSGFAIVSGIFAAEDIEAETKKIRDLAEKLCGKKAAPGELFDIPAPAEVIPYVEKVRAMRPVVHCITNIVTVNDCANALLAAGASPTMAHHPEEMEEFASNSDALVLNMGATECLEAMMTAGKAASALGHPVVVDPVGCAGSAFRREKCLDLIKEIHPACIRGNAAEIRALALDMDVGRGVDDLRPDSVLPSRYASELSRRTGAIVIASGKTDYLAAEGDIYVLHGGSELMARITGSGCMLSSLLGAFLAADRSFQSALACLGMMNACGEAAEKRVREKHEGLGSFHIALLDAMSLFGKNRI